MPAKIGIDEMVTNYSAGKRDRGKKHPLLPGAKPPDSIEQEAKPPVQWKVVPKNGFNVS